MIQDREKTSREMSGAELPVRGGPPRGTEEDRCTGSGAEQRGVSGSCGCSYTRFTAFQ